MLEDIKDLGKGGIGFQGGNGKGAVAIKELQGLTTRVVNGAAANTDIPVGELGTDDTIQSVVGYSAGVPYLVPATVFPAGNIRSPLDTTGDTLVVNFFRKAGFYVESP